MKKNGIKNFKEQKKFTTKKTVDNIHISFSLLTKKVITLITQKKTYMKQEKNLQINMQVKVTRLLL